MKHCSQAESPLGPDKQFQLALKNGIARSRRLGMQLIVFSSPELLPKEPALLTAVLDRGLQVLHLRKPGLSRRQYEGILASLSSASRAKLVLHDHHDLAARWDLKVSQGFCFEFCQVCYQLFMIDSCAPLHTTATYVCAPKQKEVYPNQDSNAMTLSCNHIFHKAQSSRALLSLPLQIIDGLPRMPRSRPDASDLCQN